MQVQQEEAIAGHETGRVMPELAHAMNIMALRYPESMPVIKTSLINFCSPWLRQADFGLPLTPSLLTPAGYPLEFNCYSNSDALTYTIEPGLPDASTADKLAFVRQTTGMGDHPASNLFASQLYQRFGCWLNVCHHRDETAYRLYHEVSPSLYSYFYKELSKSIGAEMSNAIIKPMLATLIPGTEHIAEYHSKLVTPNMTILNRLFAIAGVEKQLPLLLELFSELAGATRERLFDRVRLGVHFKTEPGRQPQLSVFAHATELFPDNATARKRILALTKHTGCDMGFYESITASPDEELPVFPIHSTISVQPTADGNINLCTGIRPWNRN